jgi:signal transduction histidine kinase
VTIVNLWAVIPLFSFVLSVMLFALGIVRKGFAAFAVFLSSAVWSFSTFMLELNSSVSNSYLIFWNGLVITSFIWVVVTYYNYLNNYLAAHDIKAHEGQKRGRRWVFFGYILVLAFLVLSLKGYYSHDAYFARGFLYHNIRPIGIVSACVVILYLTLAIVKLVNRYRGTVDPIDRNKMAYLIIGWVIFLVISWVVPLIPSLSSFPVGPLGSIANALIISYAISRYSLLDIKFVLRRGLAFALALIPLAVLLSVGFIFDLRFYSGLPSYVVPLQITALVILLVIIGLSLRRPVQIMVDRVFYGETYIHRQTLLSFTRKMGNILNLNQLSTEILQTISKAIRTSRALLLFEDPNSEFFTVGSVYPESKEKTYTEFSMSYDSPLVRWLEKESSVLTLNQINSQLQFKALWESEREQLYDSHLELFCPLKSHGKLVGILGLSSKSSNHPFTQEDIEFVMSVARQASAVVHNALLFDELQQKNEKLTGVIVENTRLFDELQQKNQKLIELDKRKSVFLSMVSHELRTPLTPIKNCLQNMLDEITGPINESQRYRLRIALKRVDEESSLIANLLDLVRIQEDEVTLKLEYMNLSEIVRSAVQVFEDDAIKKHVNLEVNLPTEDIMTRLDREKIGQVLTNLLGNAIKFTDAGTVVVSAVTRKEWVEVKVADTGIGIDPSQHESIFERFYQVDGSSTRNIGGSGIGLYIVKYYVVMHGGKVTVESKLGEGSTFIFTLPKKEASDD